MFLVRKVSKSDNITANLRERWQRISFFDIGGGKAAADIKKDSSERSDPLVLARNKPWKTKGHAQNK